MLMRAACISVAFLFSLIGSFQVVSASDKYMDIQTGDELYACNCGNDCQIMAKRPGKCTCGVEMVKARVVKSGGDKAILISDDWGRMKQFKLVGNYSCSCPDCNCGMVSQHPGICCCGVEMK